MIWQIPYANSTPSANDANIAPININELMTEISFGYSAIPCGISRRNR